MKKFIRSVEIEPVASRLDRGSMYIVLLLHALPFISSLVTTTVWSFCNIRSIDWAWYKFNQYLMDPNHIGCFIGPNKLHLPYIAKIDSWEKSIDVILCFKTAQIIVIFWLERQIFDWRDLLTFVAETYLDVIVKVQSIRLEHWWAVAMAQTVERPIKVSQEGATLFLSAAISQRQRNYLSCSCLCSSPFGSFPL